MIQYTFCCKNPQQQYIDIGVRFKAVSERHEIQLPAWRPGRYELGNFAKNVRCFKVFSEGKVIETSKITKDRWQITTKKGQEYVVSYQYYATDLNAGSTYFTMDQLYVNPVNCCIYIEGMTHLPCSVKLNVSENYQVASGLKQTEVHTLYAENFDELADSPWIASAKLKHDFYEVSDVRFNLWFQGECQPDFELLKSDFSKFTQKQLEKFGEFPFEEYHFFFQIVPFRAYHGVEHLNSTVILLGPGYDLFRSFYSELLGVSSHELYHAWNVKSIRPVEMFPYDYTKENYSELGYLCEGVTTYMGDLMLYRSGVFSLGDYLKEFDNQLQKHFDNFARFTMSVAEASFDTWLDGYVPGAPNRKVSIYTEGCLLAFVVDILMLKHTNGKHRLDDVMKRLYYDFYLQGKGVREEDFWSLIRNFAGNHLDFLYTDFYHGTKNFESIIVDALEEIGLELEHVPLVSYSASKLGFKSTAGQTGMVVKSIYPGSPADLGQLMPEDEIIGVNGIFSQQQLDEWLQHFDNDSKRLTVIRRKELIELTLPEVNRFFYLNYRVKELSDKNHQQQKLLKIWSM